MNIKNEEIVFKTFVKLSQSQFLDLFVDNFSKLKMYFFQFEQFLELILPEIAKHLIVY